MSTIEISDSNFQKEVLESKIPVLVDFWAPWCSPCHVIAPVLEKLSDKYAGKLKIAKLNVDENSESAQKYQILSIPNMKIFKNGQVVDELIGTAPSSVIEEKIKSSL